MIGRVLSTNRTLPGVLILCALTWVACVHSKGGPYHLVPPESRPDTYINPELAFPPPELKEPGEGYPHPADSSGHWTVSEFLTFGDRVQRAFLQSNMRHDEADRVYSAIEGLLQIQDGSYGMPSPDLLPLSPVDNRERVLVRKRSRDHYEVFYFVVGCGKTYYWKELRSISGEPKLYEIETWREVYPC